MKAFFYSLFIVVGLCACKMSSRDTNENEMTNAELTYEKMVDDYATGWNTWNYRSVFSHVLMPEAFAVNLGFKDYYNKDILTEAMLGFDEEDLLMGPHAYDGSYTMVELHNWSEKMEQSPLNFRIESAHVDDDLVILVEPLTEITRKKLPLLLIQGGIMWNRPGTVIKDEDKLVGELNGKVVDVFTTGTHVEEHYVGGSLSSYLAVEVNGPIGVSTGTERSVDEIRSIINDKKTAYQEKKSSFGDMAEVFDAIQTVVAWNVVYEPNYERVVCPVSRRWSLWNRGYVQYCWDTYFAAYLAASTGSREVAYINLVEMTRAAEKAGTPFVPNVEQANGFLSRDRSQPPVGSTCAMQVYNKFGEKWILELLYDDLLQWNQWWHDNRDYNGLLCYGSTPYEPVLGIPGESQENDDVNGWFGGSKESGWDGAILYEEVPFDKERHILKHWDASLNGLYIMDCISLSEIAEILGKDDDAVQLKQKAMSYQENLQRLWNQEKGFFYNKNWETEEFSDVTAINGFYPLIGGAATDEQALTIVKDYFYNPDQFWGEWIIPTISRSHPNFRDDRYWDGRIWPPVNFLVYTGLRNYTHLPEVEKAKNDLVVKSRELLLKRWKMDRYVQEDYNAHTGMGEEENQYSRFYHWGGLLGLMSLIEEGYIDFTYRDELKEVKSASPVSKE
ncbi:MAG: MGH1-like glycoside hydrolase domain-containing protein [Bacteroidota bacterium]